MYKPYNNYQIKKKFSGGGGEWRWDIAQMEAHKIFNSCVS